MRAFIAIDPSEELCAQTAALARSLTARLKGRFVPRSNYHLTLAFMENLDETCCKELADLIEEACDTIAPPLELIARGLGIFGPRNNATLWLGFAETPELCSLAGSIREGLDAAGIPYDKKRFKAHLTLARHVRISRGDLSGVPFPDPSAAAAITLYKSTLGPDGAQYSPLYVREL